MEKPKFDSVNILQNLMSFKNIERLKNEFINRYLQQDESDYSLSDFSKGILYYFDTIDGEIVVKKFEDELNEILWQTTNEIKSEIDLSNTFLTEKQKLKFWKSILKSFDYIQYKNPEVIDTFPISLKPFEEIKKYLEEKYSFMEKPQFDLNSYFSLKSKYQRTDLEKIFDFITNEDYLNSELFDFTDFFSVLNDIETDIKLKFNCSTEVMVCFLNELSNLFSDLTRKRIAESGRFLSKSNTIISMDSFNTTISRIKNKQNNQLNKVRQFFSENFPQ